MSLLALEHGRSRGRGHTAAGAALNEDESKKNPEHRLARTVVSDTVKHDRAEIEEAGPRRLDEDEKQKSQEKAEAYHSVRHQQIAESRMELPVWVVPD